MMRKAFAALLAGGICLASLSGCASQTAGEVHVVEGGAPKKVTLTFFGNKADESNVHVIEEIMTGFMKKHPDIIITYESIKGTAYYDALDRRMETGHGDDIFMLDHDTTIRLQEKGMLSDLTGLSTIEQYTRDMKEQFIHKDGIYWLPTTVSAFGLYCNMDLLKQHGKPVPQNRKELEAVCDYFVKAGITPIVANNDISLKTVAIGASYYDLYQVGNASSYFDGLNAGMLRFGGSLAEGLSLVDEMILKGYVDAAATRNTKKTSDDLESFAQGKSPFLLTGVWASCRLKNDYDAKFNYEVHPLPIRQDGALVVVNPDTRLAVNAKSKYISEAKLFVEYFTKAENLYEFCDDQCSISPLKGGESSSAKEIQPVIQSYNKGLVVPGTDYRLHLPIWNLSRTAVRKLLDGTSQNDVITELDTKAKAYLIND